jgi:hypothetical protein
MTKTSFILFVAFSAWLIGSVPGNADVTLTEDGKSDYVIVLAKGSSPADQRGAKELQTHIQAMSGAVLEIVNESESLPEKAIIVGNSPQLQSLDISIGPELGDDGFILASRGPRLFIAGPGPRGTMYGCTTFLEDLGVRFYTPAFTYIPKQSTIVIEEMDRQEIPAFEYREPFFYEAFDKDWAARLRSNGNQARLDESTGGHFVFHPFVHSFDLMIPPEEFEKHPEYFPLINGKRTGGYVQRCLSNPEVLEIAKNRVRDWIRERPDAKLISLSQNDTYNMCECDACHAIMNQYGGTYSGLYLWFVNQVAEDIEKEHPDKLIETLAYQFTEPAPTGITPRQNVRIRLCPIDCCQAHPYEKCSEQTNKDFLKALAAWDAMTDSLYIWHYNTNFSNYPMPFPDFDEFPAEARLYRNSGVKGIFFQGCYTTPGGSDSELRAYVMAKQLWDVRVDTDALVTEWMNAVYGPAAKPMRAWFDLLHEKARDPNVHFRIFDSVNVPYLTEDVIAQGNVLFDQAEKLAAGNAMAAEYVNKARLGLRYVIVVRREKVDDEFKDFMVDVRAAGIIQFREGQNIDDWEAKFIKKYAAKP